MIITQKKPMEELMAMVGDAKTVAIVGCNSCATRSTRKKSASAAQPWQSGAKNLTGRYACAAAARRTVYSPMGSCSKGC